MDYKLEEEYQQLLRKLEKDFGAGIDSEGIMVLIGVQELGKGYKAFSKDEKINLIHVATCTILEPYGYYKFSHTDEDGWPHFDLIENIPAISTKQQEHLMKDALIQYFKKIDY
ncbi:MAG: hypothetical protein ACWA41_07670 [Putridiphycobacter sp.]